jgi:hypothetical protein
VEEEEEDEYLNRWTNGLEAEEERSRGSTVRVAVFIGCGVRTRGGGC